MTFLTYILTRLREASTWAGLATILAVMHIDIDPGLLKQITLAGTALAGLAAYFIPEKAA